MSVAFIRLVGLLLLFVIGALSVAVAQSTPENEAAEKREWEQLVERFKQPQAFNTLSGQIWALTHGGDLGEAKEFIELLNSVHPGSSTRKVRTVREFKNKVATFLDSDDDLVAGIAAIVLGIAGDVSYAPALAKVLDKKDPPEDPERYVPPVTSRAQAAIALARVGAREYVPRLVAMLKSRNDHDRAGAVRALGQLKATEYAKDIAALLRPENRGVALAHAPIYALMEMGVGAEYAGEFAKVLREDVADELTRSAAYALAKIGAKQYAKDIAALLSKEFRKAEAAKVLAIMGATEYTDQIARLLDDKDGLTRSAALLALGILRANKHQARVAKHLKDPEVYVPLHAAFALVLMDADQYARQILPQVEHLYREDISLGETDFHPFVEDEVGKIHQRFKDSFARMKSRLNQRVGKRSTQDMNRHLFAKVSRLRISQT